MNGLWEVISISHQWILGSNKHHNTSRWFFFFCRRFKVVVTLSNCAQSLRQKRMSFRHPWSLFFNLSISSYKTQTTSVCVSWSKPNDLSANSRMYPRLYRFPTIWSKGGGKKHDHIWIPSTFVLSHSDVCVCILIFFPPPSACQYAGVCLGYGKGLRQRDWQGLSELNCPPTSPPCVLCNYSGG